MLPFLSAAGQWALTALDPDVLVRVQWAVGSALTGLLAWGASLPEAFLTLWTLQRACDVQIASSSAGDLNPIRLEVFAQTVRESGPGEQRTCEDVFAAMQRIVDAKDPSYRV